MAEVLNSRIVQSLISISAEQWTAAGTWATVIVALIAARIGLRGVAESRKLRLAQAQPYVVAYMEQHPDDPKLIELVIRNFGTTAARSVEIKAKPKLRRTNGSGGVEDLWMPDKIPFLARRVAGGNRTPRLPQIPA